jgi:hypothetical protein
MKTFHSLSLILIACRLMVLPAPAFAQSHVGGGDPTASDFQYFINKIDQYLLSPEGRAEFPEIEQPAFHDLVQEVRPVVKDERVHDSFGVAQTCVSRAEPGNRHFQCDLARLPKLELDNQPTFYRLTFHELLFQAGLELPPSKEVPSEFRISSRLKLKLVTHREWLPGQPGSGSETLDSTGITCSQRTLEFSPSGYAFVWWPNGDYVLLRRHAPRAQIDFGIQKRQVLTPLQAQAINLRQSVAHLLGGDLVTTVLARGNSNSILSTESWGGMHYKYRSIHHEEPAESFQAMTVSEIENTPVFTRGSYTEFPLFIRVVRSEGIRKRDRRWQDIDMVCTGEANWGHYRWIPIRRIFQEKETRVFSENLITPYPVPPSKR